MTDRKEYMREWMRNKRAVTSPSHKARMRMALEAIIAKLEGNEKPLAVEIRALANKGLADD